MSCTANNLQGLSGHIKCGGSITTSNVIVTSNGTGSATWTDATTLQLNSYDDHGYIQQKPYSGEEEFVRLRDEMLETAKFNARKQKEIEKEFNKSKSIKMNRLSLYEFAILIHPTKEEVKDKKKTTQLKLDKNQVLAKDQEQAVILINRLIPDEHMNNLDSIEILVRPFS